MHALDTTGQGTHGQYPSLHFNGREIQTIRLKMRPKTLQSALQARHVTADVHSEA